MLNILLSGSGSGGHIYPCLALYNYLKDKYNVKILIFKEIDKRIYEMNNVKYIYTEIKKDYKINKKNLMIDFECQYKINILFNMIPRGRRASYHAFMNKFKEVFDNFDGFYQIQVLNSTVGYQEAVAAKSSLSSKMIIDSKSKIAEDYRNLVKEVLEEEAGD